MQEIEWRLLYPDPKNQNGGRPRVDKLNDQYAGAVTWRFALPLMKVCEDIVSLIRVVIWLDRSFGGEYFYRGRTRFVKLQNLEVLIRFFLNSLLSRAGNKLNEVREY